MYILIYLIFFLCACGNNDDNSASTANTEPTSRDPYLESGEMIHLANGSVKIGSNDKSFRANEKPAMKVLLNYDFYIGKHEITCGEYAAIAKKAELKTFGKCKNDSLPIVDITYYDAILFANAQSSLYGHDTAYTYNKANFDKEGHCTFLEGFAFKPNVDSYRLPTEAEWIYAAKKDWNAKKGWNNSNSDYKSHKVCSKGTDATGLCDMAGNVMEWVNDWLGTFRDTTVENYIGAPSRNDKGERVVKGGYYGLSTKEINLYSRGDVYTVTSSTRADYVGFRLAYGHIPDAIWMNDEGESSTSVITSLASPETVKSITGTYNVKLVFRNDINGNLAYIDYKSGVQSVKEITKGINAYHPEISPNGNWVAFSTAFEGQAGESTLYVKNIAEDSASPIKLKNENAAIPRWRVHDNGDTVIVYVSDAGNNKDKSTFKATSTWEVPFANGKFGTPQKLFDGAYHGGFSEDNTIAVTGARLLRARIAKSGSTITKKAIDTVWYNKEQACNVSLVQDSSKRTAFLDFGGTTGRKFANENYSTHQRILIADHSGKLIQTIKAPNGYTFDHSEWATNGKTSNLVATLVNANGAHSKIALVSPKDSSVTELVEGDEIWHPNLWVKKIETVPADSENTKFKLDPDSAGIYYNSSEASEKAIYFRYKMEFLWEYRDSANTVILGSSRVYQGINPILFSKPVFAVNFAVPGTVIYGSTLLFENYILPHLKKLKIVITSIDLDRAYVSGRDNDNIFYKAYTSYPGYVYDKNHNYWKDYYPPKLFNATYDSPGITSIEENMRPTRGFMPTRTHGWGEPTNATDSCWMDYEANFNNYNKNFELFEQLLQTCLENDIVVIGVITPQNPRYKETGTFGYRGLRRSEAAVSIKNIKQLRDTYPNFILMDENNMGNHDYSDDMAADTGHLSYAGAVKLTARLDSLIQTLNIDFAP